MNEADKKFLDEMQDITNRILDLAQNGQAMQMDMLLKLIEAGNAMDTENFKTLCVGHYNLLATLADAGENNFSNLCAAVQKLIEQLPEIIKAAKE